MAIECRDRVWRLLELACAYGAISSSQMQMDSMSMRGSGEMDRLLLRLQSLGIAKELQASAAATIGLGIDAINRRVDIGLKEINAGNVPFNDRRELAGVMSRTLEHIRNDTVLRLFDIAVADVEQCARGTHSPPADEKRTMSLGFGPNGPKIITTGQR